jgi:Tfp pilus assembly protein PilE
VTLRRGTDADVPSVAAYGSSGRSEDGSITPVEAFVLGVMAAIVVAVGIPSYLQTRDRSNDSAARAHVRQAAAAVEKLRANGGTLTGVTPAALQRVDSELEPGSYRLSLREGGRYCVEASVGGRAWHLPGPDGAPTRGVCR